MCTPTPDWFASGSVSFELIKGLPAALITLGLGWVAIQIQKNQANVATAKLNLDLFDKRLNIFETTWAVVSRASQSAWNDQLEAEFSNLKPQAQFLFGQEIFNYMVEVGEKTIALRNFELRLRITNDVERSTIENQCMQLSTWFIEEAKIGCRTRFLKYLDFSKWR